MNSPWYCDIRTPITCDQASLTFFVSAGRYAYLPAAKKYVRGAWSQVRTTTVLVAEEIKLKWGKLACEEDTLSKVGTHYGDMKGRHAERTVFLEWRARFCERLLCFSKHGQNDHNCQCRLVRTELACCPCSLSPTCTHEGACTRFTSPQYHLSNMSPNERVPAVRLWISGSHHKLDRQLHHVQRQLGFGSNSSLFTR